MPTLGFIQKHIEHKVLLLPISFLLTLEDLGFVFPTIQTKLSYQRHSCSHFSSVCWPESQLVVPPLSSLVQVLLLYIRMHLSCKKIIPVKQLAPVIINTYFCYWGHLRLTGSTIKNTRNIDWSTIKNTRNIDWPTIKNTRNIDWPTIKNTRNIDWSTIKNTRNIDWSTIKDTRNIDWSTIKDTRNIDWSTIKNTWW